MSNYGEARYERQDPARPNPRAATPAPEAAAVDTTPRIISGIDLIDYGAGGLYPEKVYLVKGESGMGKTILGLQFLARGLELGENGVLVTSQRPDRLVEQARTLGFPLDEPLRRGQLRILQTSGNYFELIESPADVTAIAEELADYINSVGATRLVVDPIFALVNTAYSGHFATAVTQTLLNALEDLPVTTLLVGGREHDAELAPVVRTLEENVFGVVELAGDGLTGGRLMRLTKLRYASTEDLAAHYRILNGRGLINYRGEGETVVDVTKPWEHTVPVSNAVLVIGANSETIQRVKEALGDDYVVHAEQDVRKGVERVRSEKPGLVLVTPSRSASSVAAIAQLSRESSSAVAFLSPALNRSIDKVLYLRAGADDFIAEPFSPAELKARVEALIRRSGRRLQVRDSSIASITDDEFAALGERHVSRGKGRDEVILTDGEAIIFHSDFRERLHRNLATMSKLETPFALYWVKAERGNKQLRQALSNLCRQEDIVCRSASGELVVILTGADEAGLRGFEARIEQLLTGAKGRLRRGSALYRPGDSWEDLSDRALAAAAQASPLSAPQITPQSGN